MVNCGIDQTINLHHLLTAGRIISFSDHIPHPPPWWWSWWSFQQKNYPSLLWSYSSAPQWWWSLARVYECTVFPLSAGTSAADGFYWPLLSFELQHWTAECPEECGGSQMQIFTQPICKKVGLIVGTSCLKTHFIHHHTQSQFLGSHLSKQTKSSLSLWLRSLLVPL